MSTPVGGAGVGVAIAVVCVVTLALGIRGLGRSRTTSDFYVASRALTPRRNASAVSGEYLSAASFLGVAGLVYMLGIDMLWFPIGYTAGYVVLLIFVAAPLRRSGAYTLPDFAEARLESLTVRRLCSVMVVLIGWLYLMPLLQGAGIALDTLVGMPDWVGSLLVASIVAINVLAGGMRAVTLVQAIQYWIKLAAIAIPTIVLVALWWQRGAPTPALPPPSATGSEGWRAYSTYSTLLGLCFGTMGLPHVLVRFYTNPDGRAARRTTLGVIGLVGMFYLFPPVYAAMGRALVPGTPAGLESDGVVLALPSLVLPGLAGEVVTAIVAAGAIAAFLSTASGLTVAVTGVIDQDLVRPRLLATTGGDVDTIQSFRTSTVIATVVPFVVVLASGRLGLATTVGLAFAVAAATFAPLLVLGVWWRRLSVPGAIAGIVTGGGLTLASAIASIAGLTPTGLSGALISSPAAWAVPLAFAASVVTSLATPDRVPRGTLATMIRLHTPEAARLTTEATVRRT